MQLVERRSSVVDVVDFQEEEAATALSACLERIKHVRSKDGKILTRPFLDVCKLFLQVLDGLGTCMGLVKSDVAGNISRLETKYYSDPTRFYLLHEMVQEDIDCTEDKSSSSCVVGLLWLTRSMDFLVELFGNLLQHPDWSMQHACNESYQKTLRPWHGWFTSSSFIVGLKLVPDRERVMKVIRQHGNGDVEADMQRFCRSLSPLLQENHKFLAGVNLDDQRVL